MSSKLEFFQNLKQEENKAIEKIGVGYVSGNTDLMLEGITALRKVDFDYFMEEYLVYCAPNQYSIDRSYVRQIREGKKLLIDDIIKIEKEKPPIQVRGGLLADF